MMRWTVIADAENYEKWTEQLNCETVNGIPVEYPALVAAYVDSREKTAHVAIVYHADAKELLATVGSMACKAPGPTQDEFNHAVNVHLMTIQRTMFATKVTSPERYEQDFRELLALEDQIQAERRDAMIQGKVIREISE